jgi:hypothetical protein
VIVVVKLKREGGRPEREKVERLGVRKKLLDGEGRQGGDSGIASFSAMLGRKRGFVDGVFCSLERGAFCGVQEDVEGVLWMNEERKGDSWAMAGKASERCDVDVGEARGEEKGLTYWSEVVVSCFSRSSWWTATLKRFQNWGSRTILVGTLGVRSFCRGSCWNRCWWETTVCLVVCVEHVSVVTVVTSRSSQKPVQTEKAEVKLNRCWSPRKSNRRYSVARAAAGETEGVDVSVSEPSSRTEGYKDEYRRLVTRNVELHVNEICCGEDQIGEAQICQVIAVATLIDDRNPPR